MPNLDFYSANDDHEPIVDFVCSCGQFRLFEMYSKPDCEISEFTTIQQFRKHFGFEQWENAPCVLLQLYAVDSGGEARFEQIELKPGALGDAKFRYGCVGWGLIQLYLENPRKGHLRASHTNHNSEKRALAWADTCKDKLGEPSHWYWKEVESTSRRLNSFIRRLSVEKDKSRPILPIAIKLRDAGLKFV